MGTDWNIFESVDHRVENVVEIYQGARVSYEGRNAPQPTVGLREGERYNAAALQIMKKHGIEVDDLYAFVLPKLEKLQRPKNVHFTAEGSETLAEQVAAVIKQQLKAPQ